MAEQPGDQQGGEAGNDHPMRPLPLRIQDLDSWVERHGLQEPEYGIAESWAEARARLRQESSYQQSVHQAIFGNEEEQKENKKVQRARLLESWKNETIVITTSSTPIHHVPLKPLASASDTVFAMASSRHFFARSQNLNIIDNQNHDNHPHQQQKRPLLLSLESFDRDAVEAFLETVVGTTPLHAMNPDYMVASCQIAHYLQCSSLLDDIVDILIASIDTANCLSFCQLADALQLPRLFEQSLVHMMQTLGDLQDQDQVWGDLTPELRERILTIKSAIQSSIHTQDRGRIYFGSLTEYLAIFAENIQYHRERLAEAKERQLEVIHISSLAAREDAKLKIDKHEKRVQTLEIVMAEQKKLFGGGGGMMFSGSTVFHHSFEEGKEQGIHEICQHDDNSDERKRKFET